jgi:hypothetical protein
MNCFAGMCVTGPCDGICVNPTTFNTQSFRVEPVPAGAVCYQTTQNLGGGVCGQFVTGRSLSVNGQLEVCQNTNWTLPLPSKLAGGYCIVVTDGGASGYFATF